MLTEVDDFRTRDGTTDASAVYALAADEYRLSHRRFSGWAIDVGAHIGTVAISLARQNPGLRVIAVEAVPENADLLEHNVDVARLRERVSVVRAWAGSPNDLTGVCHYGYRHRESENDGYVRAHRYVGGTFGDTGDPEFSLELPAISLDSLMAKYSIDDVALIKIDCEGCEWAFLDSPSIGRVETIVGEYHGGLSGQEAPQVRLLDLLGATHTVHFWNPDETVIGLFEAQRA